MVKNIPAIERSTEIRFGKHVPDSTDQADNTIVFNASNVLVPTPYSNACYLSPIRNRTDYLAPEVVLLMYDRNTKEITESGESANVLVGGSTLNTVVDRANATSNTMLFIGQQNDVAFVTSSNVGISNMLPQHTLSIGSNLYVDDVGSNVLTVSGNVSLLGDLHVSGSTTLLVTENTSIKDALVELGRGNTSTDTTLDLGLLMHRPSSSSNVVIGYREGLDEFAISYTESNPNEKVFIPKTDEDINVHVYGLTHVDANIYAHEDLHVSGNTHVTGTGTSTIPSLNVYRATSSTSRTTGALIVGGGLGVGGDIHATHANLEDVEADSINITDTTASSSKTTGALKVAGGAGIQGDLYAADTTLDSVKALNLATGTLPFTDSTKKLVDSLITQNDDGSIIISANVEIAGNVSVVGNTFAITSNDVVITDRIFDIANNNTSTSLDIGILMEHPGKNIFIGHHTNPQDNFTIGYTSNGYTEDHVEWNGTDHITANVWGYLITQNTVTIEHNDLYVKNGLIGVTTESPVANIHVVGNAFVTSNITTSSNIIVGGTAAATSKTTGALQVAGGLGVAGDIHATHANLEDVEADSVNITDTTASTSKTTGALKVAGGLGVAGDIHGSSLYTDDYLIHSGDTDTKIGFPLADTFTVTTANTERLRVNATGATLSTDTSGSSANPELSLYRDQTGSNGNYLGQIRFDGKHDGGNDQLYAKITGKIKKADQGGEDGAIETAIITDGSQRISLRHTGDLFHIKKGTDFQVGETANIYVKTSTSRVGINTDSPAYSLDVQGTSNVGVFTSTDGTITNATASSSKTTGALKVAGGLGVAGDIYTTSVYAGHNTDQASYFGRGAIGFSGDTNHASFSHIDNNTSANYAIKQTEGGTTHLNTKSGQHIRFNVNNSEKMRLTGAGDLKVGSNILYVDVSESAIGVNTNSPAYSLDVQGTSNVGVFTSTGGTITDTTASSSKTTGALKVAGGLGVAGALYGGAATFDDLTVDGTTLTVDTSNDRVGVKTGSPAYTLDINGDLNFAGSLYQGGSAFVSTPWTMETSPTALSYTAGNVGIGAANPAYKLEVDGDINIKSGHNLRIAGNIPVFSNWTVSGSNINRATGNVGIGAASPAVKLHVVGGNIGLDYGKSIEVSPQTTWTNGTNKLIETGWGTGDEVRFFTPGSQSATQKMVINSYGNVGIATATPKTKLHVHGGTIINSNGVAKKTYSYSGTLSNGQTIANSTIKLTFTNHVFSAKIVAHLVESPTEVSTISFECCGGHWSGSTPSTNIATSPVTVFGPASTNPWNVDLTLTSNTVSLKPTTNMAAAGAYNVFVEYISQNSAGELSSLHEGSTAEVSDFGY